MTDQEFYAWLIPLVRARIAEWNEQDAFDEACGRIVADDPEVWLPEAEWRAFRAVQRATRIGLDDCIARYGKPLWLLEIEEIEATCSAEAIAEMERQLTEGVVEP